VADYFVHPSALVESRTIGSGTKIWAFAHILNGAQIGRDCNVGDHCFIEGNVTIGDQVTVKNGVSIWSGVRLEDFVFVGPNAVFTNDMFPRSKVYHASDMETFVRTGATIGANATLRCGISVGRWAMIGAGSVVVHDVPDFGLVYGVPARQEGWVCACGKRLDLSVQAHGRIKCACGRAYSLADGWLTEVEPIQPPSQDIRHME
jgi:acetyltransferase-like isoleucine patch superfamily enzyme